MLITEVKTCSPFGYTSTHSWEHLFKIAQKIGDMVSIHTDERWGGSFELLKKACDISTKPVLAKGIHATDEEVQQALNCGATSVLVVGRLPANRFLHKVMIEPNSLDEINDLDKSLKVVWNARDLKNGGTKSATFEEARNVFPGWLCQASFIKSFRDIHEKADAAIVGTHLLEYYRSRSGISRVSKTQQRSSILRRPAS
jgi:indole-3-glycerol phosphate synthase